MAKKSRSTQAVSIFYESSWVLPRGCPCHSHLKDRKHTLHTCSTTRKGHRLPSPAGHWLTGSLWSHWESVTGRHDKILSFFFCCFFLKSVYSFQCVSEFFSSLQHQVEGKMWWPMNCSLIISEWCSWGWMLGFSLICYVLRSFPACSLLPPGLPRIHLPLLLYWIDFKMLTWALEHSQTWAWRNKR